MSLIARTKLTNDFDGLVETQNREWSYFKEKTITVTEGLNKKNDLKESNSHFLKESTKGFKICRKAYKTLCKSIIRNFHKYISTLEQHEINEINEDVKTNGWTYQNINQY